MDTKKTKWLWVGLFFTTLLSMIFLFFVYYAPHRNIQHEKPVCITAVDLVSFYNENETSADQQFLDKAIQLEGTIVGIEENSEGKTVVVLSGGTPLSTVRCTFTEKIQLESGIPITLKGRCTGYLSDVILVDCFLVNFF